MLLFFFFFKQKTAYEMRISDWSSDVCSSDLSNDGVLRSLATRHNVDGKPNPTITKIADMFFAPPGRRDSQGIGRTYGEAVERSEEHTSELQSLMRISYAVFCLKKKKKSITCKNRDVVITYRKQKLTTQYKNTSH